MQKTFGLYHSFFALTALSLVFLALASCSFNPNYQGKGNDVLQGEWRQDSVEKQKQLVSYALYNFRFSCDSFYVKIASVSKVNYGADTCMNKGHWVEYAKGTYEQKSDTVHMNGFFCNPDYTLKKEGGCFRFGAYDEQFKLSSQTDSVITLSPFSATIPIQLKLVKKTACIQKPL